ncbi:Piso0_004992 [Millerozyma farinosa CBS 7064]|uniref:Piso0_004992 protein n=1 Tax=Pichia sorbitophila (strain ATCC MYA-4447 / BCRC 22081 / CBS 7064 / NBRC 10061 / NRRL Y-12695) TaxID=559304 RepID=G8Y0Z4_PICSO|nr:Piso0_004992 [Millerozyma farinosa CBS 7064]
MKTNFISYALCGGFILPGFIAALEPLPNANSSTLLSNHNDNANKIASDDLTRTNVSGQDFKFGDVIKSLTDLEFNGYDNEQFLTIGKPNRTVLRNMNYNNTSNKTRNIYKKYGKNFSLKQNLKKLKHDKTSKSFPKFSNNTKPLHDLVSQMVKNGKQRINFNSTEWNLLSSVFNSSMLGHLQTDKMDDVFISPSDLLNSSAVYQKLSVLYDSLVSNQTRTAITLESHKEEGVSGPTEPKAQDIPESVEAKPIRKLVSSDDLVSSKDYRKPSSYSLSRVISFFKDYKANKKYKYYDPDNLYETKITSTASVKDASSGLNESLGSGNYTAGYNITFDGSRRFKFFPTKKNTNSTSVTPSNSNSTVPETFSSGSRTLVVSFYPLFACLIFGSYLV